MEIHVLNRQGSGIRSIAKQLCLSRNTVRRYLRDKAKTPQYRKRNTRHSKLEPFKSYLQARIEAAKPNWIPATVLFRELLACGYDGKEGIIKNDIRKFKYDKGEDPIVRFETAAGEQLQVDFTTIHRGMHKFKALVATLGYSRASYVRFSEYERQDDWLTGIEAALHYFGGVPREILFDNAKCIMIERDAYGEGKHRWNAKLLSMAKDYGFKLRACRPYRARTKGKVERFNGYLKNSFITPLTASLKQVGLHLDVDTANGQIGQWLNEVANQRIHATTGKKPQTLLEQERFSLQPLPVLQSQGYAVVTERIPQLIPMESLQHPLSVYDQLLGNV